MKLLTKAQARKSQPIQKMAGLEKKQLIEGYVFDESQVLPQVPFCQFLTPQGALAIGISLPKNVKKKNREGSDILNERGEPILTQIEKPIIITEQGYLDASYTETSGYKVTAIPSEMTRRWSLPAIKNFLEHKTTEVNPKHLFEKIRKQYTSYLYFEEPWYNVHTLWDVGTYFFTLFQAFPLMELRGFKATSKSKTMDVSRLMTFNATKKWINPSEATLFREIHTKRPTKYLDEAERFFKFERGQLVPDDRIEVINSSFEQGSTVPRQERTTTGWATRYFDTYSPTMVGSIRGLYGATEDRAIVHVTTRAPKTDKRMNLEPEETDPLWQEIRDELYAFMFQQYNNVIAQSKALSTPEEISARDFKIWRPLLTLATLIDQRVYDSTLAFAKACTQIKEVGQLMEAGPTYDMLKYIWHQICASKEEQHIYIKQIHQNLLMENKPGFKSLANTLDKFGFMHYKARDSSGTYYKFTSEHFYSIIHSIDSSFFSSFTTYSTPLFGTSDDSIQIQEETVANNNVEYPVKSVESSKKVKNNCVEYVEYVANVGDRNDPPTPIPSAQNAQILALIRSTGGISEDQIIARFQPLPEAAIMKCLQYLAGKAEIFAPKPGFWKVLE